MCVLTSVTLGKGDEVERRERDVETVQAQSAWLVWREMFAMIGGGSNQEHVEAAPWDLACPSFVWMKKQDLRREWLCGISRNRPLGTIGRDMVECTTWHGPESWVTTTPSAILRGTESSGSFLSSSGNKRTPWILHHGPVLCCRKGPCRTYLDISHHHLVRSWKQCDFGEEMVVAFPYLNFFKKNMYLFEETC